MPATKSALRGSHAVPVTKSALRGPPSAAPAAKSALVGSPSAAPATKSALRGSQSAVPVTKSAIRGSPSAAPATKSALRCSPSAVPATKSANEPHVQKSRFTAPVTKSELLDDHHHVQSAAPATKTAFPSETPPTPCTCHEKSTLEHQNTRIPLRLPRKVTTMCENVHGTTMRAQSPEAPAADTQIQRACAVEVHMYDVESHQCIVNSSELAGHAHAEQRSKHTFLSPTVRTPECVHTVWGKKLLIFKKLHNFSYRPRRFQQPLI